MSVVIETTIGDVTVDLYVKERPRVCLNFLKLCKLKYYNFNLFYYIQNGFIAQSGDPTGTGRGGNSVFSVLYGEQARYFEAEKIPRIPHKKIGSISMVGCDTKGNLGSQFFFTLGEDLNYLDGEHCVFGEITEGIEVLEKFNDAICDDENRPYQDIRVTHTVVLDDPFDDPVGLESEIPPASPEPTPEILDSGRIGADEIIDDTDGKTLEEIEEAIKDKEAKAQATILEMVGDLPDADIAPPENVLFVCKLNPVTTDEDLEIIFCRFGKINSCEVIRDYKTGESLQYAFIEFDDNKSCEDAYFKMDNVLIDERRIHVDFSQSVSKYQWRGKGRGVKVDHSKPDPGDKKQASKSFQAPWIRQQPKSSPHSDHSSQKDHSRQTRSPVSPSLERTESHRRNSRNHSDSKYSSYSSSSRRRERSPLSPPRSSRRSYEKNDYDSKYSSSRRRERSPLSPPRFSNKSYRRNDYDSKYSSSRRRELSPQRSSRSSHRRKDYDSKHSIQSTSSNKRRH